MTAKPYIVTPASVTIELNSGGSTVESEDINKSQPILSAAAAGGQTKDNLLATLMSGDRKISIRGTKKAANKSALDSWFQSIDALAAGAGLMSITYYPDTIETPYAGQGYFKGFISIFNIGKTQEMGGEAIASFSIEISEGKGLAD